VTAASLTASKEVWYLMRASGLVAVALLTLTTVGGLLNVRRFTTPRFPRAVTALLHRNMALLTVSFLAAHVATAALDSYVVIGPLAAIVPFTSQWDRIGVGLGTASIDMMLAVIVSSLVRARLTHRTWRAVHWLAYAVWPLAMIHGYTAGTDSGTRWGEAVYLISLLAVVAAAAWRLLGPAPTLVRPRRPCRLPTGGVNPGGSS
jgi:predicted ferric reductase